MAETIGIVSAHEVVLYGNDVCGTDANRIGNIVAGVELPDRQMIESAEVHVDWLNPESPTRYSDLDLRLMEPFHD